jgi:hypothetical protein
VRGLNVAEASAAPLPRETFTSGDIFCSLFVTVAIPVSELAPVTG